MKVMSIPEDKAQSSKESEDELNNNECNQNDDLFPIDREAYKHIFKVGAIRFFKNGCFAPKDEKFLNPEAITPVQLIQSWRWVKHCCCLETQNLFLIQ